MKRSGLIFIVGLFVAFIVALVLVESISDDEACLQSQCETSPKAEGGSFEASVVDAAVHAFDASTSVGLTEVCNLPSCEDATNAIASANDNVGHSVQTTRLDAEPRHVTISKETARGFIAELNAKKTSEIYGFLDTPSVEFAGLSVPEVAAVKNQVMDYMLLQKNISPDFGFKLVEIVRNVSNDTLLRVFAVQHLDLYAGTLWNRGRYDSAGDEAAYIRNALTEAVLDSESPIGGAAMLALEKMSHFDDFIDVRKLAAQAAAYAGTGSIDLQTRIAAVHLCGTMRIPQASQALDGIINDDRSNTVLELAARHSLARIAGKP